MAEQNPYPPGSARYKLWERREADRRKKEAEKEMTPPRTQSEGKSARDKLRNRRRSVDEAVDEAERGRVERLRENQSTDSNN